MNNQKVKLFAGILLFVLYVILLGNNIKLGAIPQVLLLGGILYLTEPFLFPKRFRKNGNKENVDK